jgi:hypothetical protein
MHVGATDPDSPDPDEHLVVSRFGIWQFLQAEVVYTT